MNQKLERISDINTQFDKWYIDVVKQAGLMDYGDVKGTMIIRPYGWKIWELITEAMNKRFAKHGIENIAMPLFIPKTLIDKEKAHVKGFAPEILTVTKYGNNNLEEPFYIRPTSEALFMNQFKKDVKSFRTLPIKWNQWCSVVRWEKKTKPFLRSTEFHWQEGHTVHASDKEANAFSKKMIMVYNDLAKKELAIPMFIGKKTEFEKFSGALETYTIEAMMKNGKALQAATSHYFGDNFTKAYDIKFQNQNNQVAHPYTTSWGISTRIIGAIIMAHGDKKGLVLPPNIAPYQVTFLPLINKDDQLSLEVAIKLEKKLGKIRTFIDSSDKSLGFKSANAEIRGIPIRIEIGPRDLANNEITIVKRTTGHKEQFNLNGNLKSKIKLLLQDIQEEMYKKALEIKESKTKKVFSYAELKKQVKEGYALVDWCNSKECELGVKAEIGATTRCKPFKNTKVTGHCTICNKPAKTLIYFSLAY